MSKHTPGPWIIKKSTQRFAGQRERINRIVIGAETETGGMFKACEINGPFVGDGREEANACLIAASPDLLYAIKNLVDLIMSPTPYDDKKSFLQHARLAISRAEGNQ